jgi:hypothetical protein
MAATSDNGVTMTIKPLWALAAVLLLAPVAHAETNGTADNGSPDEQGKNKPAGFGNYGKDMFASFGPELNLVSANGNNGGPYTSQMVLPSLEFGTYTPGLYFESELTTWGLLLVPVIAPAPDNDYSWMVPPAAEDPSVHYVKISLLSLRFGFALGEVGPVRLGLSLHGDARAAVYGVYVGGFDTSATKIGGTEWTQGIGVHAIWDVVDRVRLDLAAMPFFGFDPQAEEFFTSRGGRAFGDLSWAVWPDVIALRASGSYEYLDWTSPSTAGVFHITTARLGVDVYFDIPD